MLVAILIGGIAAPDLEAGNFFATFDNGVPPNTAIFGSAVVETTGGVNNSGVLKLTKNLAGQQGSFIVPDFDAGVPVVAFTARFKVLVGGGTQPPADGFSFCWAPDLPDAAFGEEGAGTGLIFAFDIFDNGNGEAPAIDVKYGGATLASMKVPLTFLESGTNFWDVSISVAANGLLNLVYHGQTVYANFLIPNFKAFARARFGFGARTGSLTENQWVEDLQLTTTQAKPPTISSIADLTINEDTTLANIPFTIGDDQTPAGSLLLSASSSNLSLVPPANIIFGGTGSSRTVTIAPAADQFGQTIITITVTDSDGAMASDNFLMTVNPVNDAPTFRAGADQMVNEDAGPLTVVSWAMGISAGPPNESNQTVSFILTGNSNPGLFSAGPAVSSNGTLTYTPAVNANGSAAIVLVAQDNGGTLNGGMDTSKAQSFTITVNAVNDPPSFKPGANQTVNEDAGAQTAVGWATAISPGPADESNQTVIFILTGNSNPGLFSADPAVSSSGTLTYTPAANANGTATITLVARDSGGTLNGGMDTSAAQSFTISVNAVNDAHSFTNRGDQTVNEDAGPQTVVGWATAISAGPPNESSQAVNFTTVNSNPGLFSAGPAVSSSGTLTYTPAANANGFARIILGAQDNGGTLNGGIDTSPPQSFIITVNAVNDAPSFIKGPNQTVNQNAGPQTVSTWATAISPGPADEAGQALSFLVSNDNNGLFAAQPAISPSGTLTYTPATGINGSATVTARLQDNGGTANGGIDTSPPQSFNLTVSPPPPPEPPRIIIQPQSQTVTQGNTVTLFVLATGTAPLFYQWRHNGANIPGATAAAYTVSAFALADGGNYSVAVANPFGVAVSETVQLLPSLPIAPLADNFAGRATIANVTFTGIGNNRGATKEPGEPNHADNRGGKSVWLQWTPPVSGIATISTKGSTFDTLLAVYQGISVTSLIPVAQDDDRGGFFTSLIQFNVLAGQSYEVAIDGFAGVAGDIVLELVVEATTDRLPEIIGQSSGRTVRPGVDVTFSVTARAVNPTPALAYQWLKDDAEITGATDSSYTIRNVQPVHVGTYTVRVSQGARAVLSHPAILQINTSAIGTVVDNIATSDKLDEAVLAAFPQGLPPPIPTGGEPPPRPPPASGYTGTQIFQTYGKTKDEGEPNHCGILGGASELFFYQAPAAGTLLLNTDGSNFDTVLAVYTNRGPVIAWSNLVSVVCDDNSGRGGTNSAVTLPVTANTLYVVAIDGVNAATGTVQLNYRLVGPVRITSWSFNTGQFQLQFIGQPGANFTLQGATSLAAWSTLLISNSASGSITYTDPNSPNLARRYYRVLQE